MIWVFQWYTQTKGQFNLDFSGAKNCLFQQITSLNKHKHHCHASNYIHRFYWWIKDYRCFNVNQTCKHVAEDNSVFIFTTQSLNSQMDHICWHWKAKKNAFYPNYCVCGSKVLKHFRSEDAFGSWWLFRNSNYLTTEWKLILKCMYVWIIKCQVQFLFYLVAVSILLATFLMPFGNSLLELCQ